MHAMRGGRHFVEFAITNDEQNTPVAHLGVIRPVSLTNGIDFSADWRGQVYPMNVSSTNKAAISEKLISQRTTKWGDGNVHCCTYYSGSGSCHWTDWENDLRSDWQGHEGLGGSDKVGLLLDLNEGTLSVFKNGRFLCVIKDGLGGEYAWFVSVYSPCTISMSRGRAPD